MSQPQDLSIKDTAFYKQATEYLRSVDLGDFADAPSDNKPYARRNREWVEVVGGGGGGSTNYELKNADFTAEAGKNYAVDAHPVPAVYPTFSYGGLVFTAKSPTSTATISWSNDGDLYGDGPNNFYIAGTETLNDIIVFINGNDFSFTVALDEGAELTDAFPDDGAQEFTFSGGSAAGFSSVEATLPSNPSTGDVVGFADARGQWGSYPLIVLRNGKKIEGGTANFVNNAAGTFFSMVFIDNATGWRVLTSGTKPLNLTAPTVAGTYEFTSTNGTWTGSPTSFNYQWQMSEDGETGWTNIEDADASTYTALEADEGKYVRIGVIATNSNGPSTVVYSAASSAIDIPDFPTSGLVAFWKLNDNGSGGLSVSDSSGNGNHLINNNTVDLGTGVIAGCAEFDGTNKLTNSTSNYIDWASDFTASLWVYIVANTYEMIFAGSQVGNFFLNYTGTGLEASQGGVLNISEFPVSKNVWHHVAVTRSSSTIALWVDGELVDSVTPQGTWTSSGNVRLGYNGTVDIQFFTGKIDAVGVWSRVLSNGEIALLYNNGNGVEP